MRICLFLGSCITEIKTPTEINVLYGECHGNGKESARDDSAVQADAGFIGTDRSVNQAEVLSASSTHGFGGSPVWGAGEEYLPLTSKLTCAEVVALVKIIRPS